MPERTLSVELTDCPDEFIAGILSELPLEVDIHTSPLAGEILYTRNEPARWARICEMSLRDFDPPLERRIALGLEVVNGIRRIPGRWDIERARMMLESLSLLIGSLPELNPFKMRLGGLALYHAGIVEHVGGDFLKAALCHQLSATLPGVSPRSQAIANFMAANERINDALVNPGAPSAELATQFADCDRELQNILDMETTEGRRWYVNLLCFRQRAAWLSERPLIEADIIEIFRSKGEFGNSFDHCFAVLNGAFEYRRNRGFSLDVALAPHVDLDWKSEALLVRAQYEQARGNVLISINTLRGILAMEAEGHGGHVARAIARRMLESSM